MDQKINKDNVIDNIGTFYLVRAGVSREIYIRCFQTTEKKNRACFPNADKKRVPRRMPDDNQKFKKPI